MTSKDTPATTPDAEELWRRDEPQSPCVNVCVIHPSAEICVGCARTMAEISAWPNMTAAQRRQLIDLLPPRFDRLRAVENRPSRQRQARRDAAKR
ncbi:MAG: DUF1289 domain-containing protein [Neomegalonema sp.]|nr:DUF1289 domain-containing protein [Neomegalonema sp.]